MLEELVQIAIQKMEQAAKVVFEVDQKLQVERNTNTLLQQELTASRKQTEHLSAQQSDKINRMQEQIEKLAMLSDR